MQFVEVDGNFRAYNLFSHRHTPEILEHTGLPESRWSSPPLAPIRAHPVFDLRELAKQQTPRTSNALPEVLLRAAR